MGGPGSPGTSVWIYLQTREVEVLAELAPSSLLKDWAGGGFHGAGKC